LKKAHDLELRKWAKIGVMMTFKISIKTICANDNIETVLNSV